MLIIQGYLTGQILQQGVDLIEKKANVQFKVTIADLIRSSAHCVTPKGKRHCPPSFLSNRRAYVRKITEKPVLMRWDSANDSKDNVSNIDLILLIFALRCDKYF